MQIHELNEKQLTDPAWVVFDDGTDTYKAEFNDVVADAAADAVQEAFDEADISNNEITYTSGDASSPTSWESVNTLTSGLSLATLFNRISTMIKNVRFLWSLIGNVPISNIATTITGAIGNTALSTDATTISAGVTEVRNLIGRSSMGTTATTVTGAIAEHESDISTLNGKTTGSGTATNQYGSCAYTWAMRGNVATVCVEYTPNINVTNSSGAFSLSTIPSPAIGVIVSDTSPDQSFSTVYGSARLSTSKSCDFYGPRTSGAVYRASFTYVVA